jgi:hypothetical protein
MQDLTTLAFKNTFGGFQNIVTHPHLKQVAQDEKRVGLQALHGLSPYLVSSLFTYLKMQIGNKGQVLPGAGVNAW